MKVWSKRARKLLPPSVREQCHSVRGKRALKLQPPSSREGDREAVVGVSKVRRNEIIDFIIEGTP